MDTLRGLAIVLVIANHAIYNAQEAYDAVPRWLTISNDILAPIRMPTMVFLSGMLLHRSLGKGARRYLVGKVQSILWPFLVWTLVAVAYAALAGRFMDGEARWLNPLAGLVEPFDHLWFLQYIFIFYVIALITTKLHIAPLWVAAAAILTELLVPPASDRFLLLLACFMIGAWVSNHRAAFERIVRHPAVLAVSGAVLAGLVVLGAFGVDLRAGVRYEAVSMPLVIASVIVFARSAMVVADQRWTGPLQFVGRQSIVYYLVHGYIVIVGVAAGYQIAGGLAGILVGFVAALAVSTVVALVNASRFSPVVAWAFVWPKRARAKVEPVRV